MLLCLIDFCTIHNIYEKHVFDPIEKDRNANFSFDVICHMILMVEKHMPICDLCWHFILSNVLLFA